MSGKFNDFDSSKIGQTFKRTKFNSVKADQSNIFRVLPPFGKLGPQNKIAQYWAVHYGFAYSKRNNKSIPITCSKVTKYENNKPVVTQRCPLCDKVEAMENAIKALAINADNQAAALTLAEKLKSMNLDKKYYLNVLTRENTVEVLKVGIKHFKALESELKRLRDELGRNAAGITGGLFLDFRKSGKGRDTVFTVTPFTMVQRDPNTGELTSKYMSSDLTTDTLTTIERDAKELTDLFRAFSVEDLTLISKGDEATIQRLFSAPVQDEAEDESGDEGTAESVSQSAAIDNAMDEALANTLKKNAAPTAAVLTSNPPQAPVMAAQVNTPVQATTTTVSAGFDAHKKPLTVDEIIAQFQKGG